MSTKTSANKRLLLCLLPFAADVQTSPAQVHGAKVLQNLRMCKKNRILVQFFWCGVYGVECKGRNLLGGKSPSTKQTSGKCPNTIGGEITIIGNLFRISILRNRTFCGRGVDALLSRSSLGRRSVELGKV